MQNKLSARLRRTFSPQTSRSCRTVCVCVCGRGRQAHLRESRKKRRTRSWTPGLLFWGPWWWACMGPAALRGLQPSSHSCFSHHSAAEPPGQRLSQERMLFLKHSVSTFLRPGGCDAEKHKNKMTEGWRQTGCCTVRRKANVVLLCFYSFSCLPSHKKKKNLGPAQKLHCCCWLWWRRCAAPAHGDVLREGPSRLWGWFIKPPTFTTACFQLPGFRKCVIMEDTLIFSSCCWSFINLQSVCLKKRESRKCHCSAGFCEYNK